MKKLAIALSALLFIFSSCSSDSETDNQTTNPDPNTVLLKKTIDTDVDGTITTIYNYNGYKLTNAVGSDGTSIVFTYTGDLLTKMEYFTGTTLDQRDTFAYDTNGKLITFLRLSYDVEWGDKTVYTHNADGTISFTDYNGDLVSQTSVGDSGKIYLTNGEVSKTEYYNFGTTTVSSFMTYTYDSRNNPFKNVIGLDKINFNEGDPSGVNRNLLSASNSVGTIGNVTYTYTYNANDFPVTSVETFSSGTLNSQLFYE